ncbi:MAG: universal stress protein [Candidatus Binataceae bacterium]
MFRKILCPVDFSDNSMAVLRQAAKLARRHDALLYLMHVEFVPMGNLVELAQDVTLSTEPGKLRLEQVARKLLPRVRHEVVVQFGRPAELIEKAAKDLDVDLIVMATQGRTGIDRLFLGSVAEHVVRRSVTSVLSFGPATAIRTLKKILCPVAFDPNSIAALRFGWSLAQEYRAAMSLLHVVPLPFEPSEVPAEPPIPEWEQDARAELAKVAAENLGPKARCKLVVRRGDPAGAILEVEKELRPDLIVMATHGRTGLSHLVLGSVAERTVRESTVPVLTVRGQHTA